MTVHIIAIATAAAVENANAVFEALGHGPQSLSRKATTAENPGPDAPATHWFMAHQHAPDDLHAQLLTLAAGELPALPEGLAWGEGGVISEAEALAAMAETSFGFNSFDDGITPAEQVVIALSARGLRVIPFAEA